MGPGLRAKSDLQTSLTKLLYIYTHRFSVNVMQCIVKSLQLSKTKKKS